MDHKIDNNNYIFPGRNQVSNRTQRVSNQHDSRMMYVKAESPDGVLGSPINHSSFRQYKDHPQLQRQEDPIQNVQTPQRQEELRQAIQDYNRRMQLHFELQRQYMGPGNIENAQTFDNQSEANLRRGYSFPTQFQGHGNVNMSPSQMNSMLTRPANTNTNVTSNESPVTSRPHTPIEGHNETSSSRKRARKSDHAIPGDEGDNELKQMAFKASELPLTELALRIKLVENDDSIPETKQNYSTNKESSKERHRQIFGMVWLLSSCESSPTAVVPRNRIYARYVQVCADNSLKPLSPASFGKLVRILFPSLTTRRLGMRGQSKYHYCGIKLVGDQSVQAENSPSSASPSFGNDSPQSMHNLNTPSVSSSPVTGGPTLNLSSSINSILSNDKVELNKLKYIPNLFNLIDQSLNMENMNSPLNLPSIYPYLPQDSDCDIADTLYSLYKVHCTSMFEFLRYMQVKKLLSSFASFNGILTAPVFKLYTNDLIFEWVNECDTIMYKTMVKMLTKLHLQSVPDDVLRQLKQIGSQFVEKLTYSLQNKVSKSFMIMKLKNAKKFTMVLSRLIRVIETGYSASRILNSEPEKQAMLDDWVKLDINEIVLREIPCSNENVESLLNILNIDFLPILHEKVDGSSILPKCANFIAELPSSFSQVKPRLFILVASNFLTTCLREISLSGGQGFGTWWIVRCWVDEYISWCFELGGYFQDEFNLAYSEGDTETKDSDPSRTDKESKSDSNTNTNANTDTVMSQLDDASNDQLRFSSIIDLLDGAYGAESTKEDLSNQESVLNYDTVAVENFLGRSDDILG